MFNTEFDLFAEQIKTSAATADEATRKSYINKLRALAESLESPGESIHRIIFLGIQPAVCRVASDLHLFEILAKNNGPMTIEDLAKETHCDPVLLSRLLRFLASTNMITEAGDDTFIADKITRTLATPGLKAGLHHIFDCCSPAYLAFPEFLKSTGYKNPEDASYAPFNLAHRTKLPVFQWMQETPDQLKFFSEWMPFQRQDMSIWLDVYPMQEAVKDLDPQRVLFVDVGGGIGHQCALLKNRYPEIPGRIILQDQSTTLESALSTEGVETMEHDFFKPQKIKNAKFYYLRNILHDWPDAQCRIILSNLRDAMGPDSFILIDEMVLPNSGTNFLAMNLDMNMMTIAATERTQKQWTKLLNETGLKVQESWLYTESLRDTIQACVPK